MQKLPVLKTLIIFLDVPKLLSCGGDSISGFEHYDWVDSSSDDDSESDDDFESLPALAGNFDSSMIS